MACKVCLWSLEFCSLVSYYRRRKSGIETVNASEGIKSIYAWIRVWGGCMSIVLVCIFSEYRDVYRPRSYLWTFTERGFEREAKLCCSFVNEHNTVTSLPQWTSCSLDNDSPKLPRLLSTWELNSPYDLANDVALLKATLPGPVYRFHLRYRHI
jgi:hypothetical protein